MSGSSTMPLVPSRGIAVLFAGPLMNILLAILIFGTITYFTGMSEPAGPTIGEVKSDTYAERVGFQKGDMIVAIDEKEVKTWTEIYKNSKGRILAQGEARSRLPAVVRRFCAFIPFLLIQIFQY